MAQGRVFCPPCARFQLLLGKTLVPTPLLAPAPLLVPFRGKKTAKKQKKKMKKDPRAVEMREFAKRMEMQKIMLSATLKAVKKGDPFDPEMLNPARKRPSPTISKEEKDRRFLLAKDWSRWKMEQHKEQLALLRGMMQSRDKALKELKRVSSTLYLRALETNTDLFPLDCQGPTATPPKFSYIPPDPDS